MNQMASLPVLLLLVTARCASAQPSPPSFTDNDRDPYGAGSFNAATAVLIVVIVSGFLFLAFFLVYCRRCSRDRAAAVLPAISGAVTASRRGARGRGLDPAVIETFPTLSYSAARGLKAAAGGEEGLECAVCLSEFSGADGDETLRMLPKCCHVFHPECIDTWLECHVTCPVCRADLSLVGEGPTDAGEPDVTVGCNDDEEVTVEMSRMDRSHSTSHVMRGPESAERFRLRLPEHMRREMVEAGRLRRSASVAVVRSCEGERSSRRGYRPGTMSERWGSGILAMVEGSLRGGGGGGTLNCLGGGSREETGTAAAAVLERV